MDSLKKFFPFAFKEKKDVVALVINVIIQLVINAVLGVVITLLAGIPVLGAIIGAVGGLVGLYFFISIVLSFLDYFKVIK